MLKLFNQYGNRFEFNMPTTINIAIEHKSLIKGNIASLLSCYGVTHCLVDAACVSTVLGTGGMYNLDTTIFVWYILLYNVLAFGTQALFGLAVDKYRVPRVTAITGCLLVIAGTLVVYFEPLIAVILVGLGNSLFHVGGGAISLNLTPNKASAPGIFVAPGSLGLACGTLIGTKGLFIAWPFIILLLIAIAVMFLLDYPEINYNRKEKTRVEGLFELVILLLLLSISIRALIGLSLHLEWKADLTLLSMLVIAIMLGKALGGVLADRFGWMRVGITALIISAPMLAFGYQIPVIAIIGAFLFQMTMPITLVAVATMFPGRPAFAFGLPCLALLLGALSSFSSIKYYYEINWVILLTIICGIVSLFIALKLYFKHNLNTIEQKV